MPRRLSADSVDDYISAFPAETRRILEELRALIRSVAPEATEGISYAIPTFDLHGRHLVHYAAYARHVGFYPVTAEAQQAFEDELRPYKRGRGSVQFPLGKPVPLDLIRRMVEFRVAESNAAAAAGRAAG